LNERILHHIWKFQRFNSLNLKTLDGKNISILNVGKHNFNQGTDFLEVKILIDDLIWVGNVEIHVKASDFYLHRHQNQENYKKIILHVVFYNDLTIYELEENNIPTLELKNFVDKNLIQKLKSLENEIFNFIPCEHLLIQNKSRIPSFCACLC